ncbi:efflux RND transporter permease subunit [Ketobacter sp.]|uniref:efflux RND transporter permease subunit n=1 Tax=Ketobacter sp. TaxID=2083498 RepID=UPI000F2B100C|nr:efflux RND transporter permease subunit [Ketobacter sp.]RLU00140.1 MAG: efflux RND transporter permease subunit [Ketobacter sp.]
MDIFVRRPVLAVVISLVLLLAGGFAALQIPVIQFPQIESSSLEINTSYPGSSAEVVQGFITEPIERAAMTIPGVDYVDATTTAGQSKVTAWLELNEDSTRALAELSARLAQIRYELPEGAEDPAVSVVRADRPAALFYLDVQGDQWTRSELTDYLEREVNPLFAAIDGVQRVGLEGGRSPAMRVWIDPLKIAALNMGADDVLGAIRANNVIATMGKTENDQRQIHLLSNATLQTVADFEQLVVSQQEGAMIRLGDIARVELGETRGTIKARYDQKTTVYISIWPLPGANEIAIGDEVYTRLATINAALPRGLVINTGYDGTIYMRESLREIFTTLFETIILVGIVVLVLMGSFRTALVPLVTIPISILGSIAVIYSMGFALNLLTILAVVLSVGLVVDDAIVVVENVARHLREGRSRMEAALVSSRELLSPIIAMTFTLAAVYTPIGFVSGFTGSLFKEFAFTLATAVIISGVVAITLSPIMSAWVCADNGRESRMTQRVNGWFDRLRDRYITLLSASFAWRNQILFTALFITLLAVPFYLFSAKELAPIEDQNSINIIIESPPNASLEYTDHYMHDVIDLVQKTTPGLKMVWQIISPDGGFGGIEFVDFAQREQSVQSLLPTVFQRLNGITGVKVFPILFPSLPTAGQFDVELVVQSPDDYQTMEQYAGQLIQAAYQSGQFMFVDTDLNVNLPQGRLRFDHDRIADLGMDIQYVSNQLASLLAEMDANRFNADGKAYRVIPMVEHQARDNPDAILDVPVRTPAGELVPLRTIAELESITGPRSLGKFNQQRSFRIYGGVLPGTTNGQALATLEQAAADVLPANYTIDYAGISRQLKKEGNSMVSVLVIAIIVVYLALAIQFNSFRLPLVVMVGSVPLALSGAMLFTFLSFTTINIYSQIGFITLVGLIAKNGILITEFAHEQQRLGQARVEAITAAAALRLRPVLMTTAATVLGHFPLVLVTGPGAEARNSIGIILVAGMAVGTLFTLFILPSVYLWLAEETPVSAPSSADSPLAVPA